MIEQFVCFHCGLYWSVDESYDAPEPAEQCPQCGDTGRHNGFYSDPILPRPERLADPKEDEGRARGAKAEKVARQTSFPSVGGGYPKLCPHGNLEQFPGDCDLCTVADSTESVLTMQK